ncbi:MAG: hypothetical protein AAFQ83_18920 [Bacteroidota bacterium]
MKVIIIIFSLLVLGITAGAQLQFDPPKERVLLHKMIQEESLQDVASIVSFLPGELGKSSVN